MTLLERYLLKEFFRTLLLVISSLIAVYLLIDFFERIDNFSDAGQMGLALNYFLLKIPVIFDQLAPVSIMLTGIITLGLLHRRHELMSFNSGGLHLFKILIPIFIGGALVTTLSLANGQWLFPHAISETDRIWQEDVQQRRAKGIVRHGRTYHRGNQEIYSFKNTDDSQKVFRHFNYTAWDKDYKLAILLLADEARWQDEHWLFRDGQLKTARRDGTWNIEIFKEKTLAIPVKPGDLFQPAARTSHLSLWQLFLAGTHQDSQRLIELHNRLSFIFLGLPLLILALPVMLVLQHRFNWDMAMTVPCSTIFAFAAWGLWNSGQALSKAAILGPFIASWSLHLILLTTGGLLLWWINNRH